VLSAVYLVARLVGECTGYGGAIGCCKADANSPGVMDYTVHQRLRCIPVLEPKGLAVLAQLGARPLQSLLQLATSRLRLNE
jgi:hypothetical protein